MKHPAHSEISAKVDSSPAAPQTNPSGDLGRYRAEANLNLCAVVEFYVTARDVSQARQRAEAILKNCAPKIEVRVPTGETMEVTLHPENIETELLEIVKGQPASEQAQEQQHCGESSHNNT